MKRRVEILILFFGLSLFSGFIVAQDQMVFGVVHTLENIPLIGASVMVKSTGQTVETDTNGNFLVACNNKDKFVIEAEGFLKQNVKIKGRVKLLAINMKLKPGKENLEYAIGYGYVSEKDRTTAVAHLNYTDDNFQKYVDVYELIRARFAGVEVNNGEIVIRGINTLTSSNSALIIIDGVVATNDELKLIAPVNVKSINVIKDGSSAVYGSRGANGVISIETKKGGEL